MQSPKQQLVDALRTEKQTIAERITDGILANVAGSYNEISRASIVAMGAGLINSIAQALETEQFEKLGAYAGELGQQRANAKVELKDVVVAAQITRQQVWDKMEQIFSAGEWDNALVKQVETAFHIIVQAIVTAYNSIMVNAQNLLAEREEALAYQGQLIQELSTPIVPVFEGVLVLPLTGAVDSRRATQIMESALEQIVGNQADVLILDITGVPVVDTGVANYLIQMARAVNLLGAQVVLVGIGAEIAQTIVQLGVELRNIVTRSNLQAGIEYALRQRGYAIQEA
jgi:rsbT co-antagonist protein RsbR